MNERDLKRLLRTSIGEDAGCEEAFALLDQYVEARLAGWDVEALMPAVAEHLRNCPPCNEEQEALLALVREHSGP
jgi:hypothetical protein